MLGPERLRRIDPRSPARGNPARDHRNDSKQHGGTTKYHRLPGLHTEQESLKHARRPKSQDNAGEHAHRREFERVPNDAPLLQTGQRTERDPYPDLTGAPDHHIGDHSSESKRPMPTWDPKRLSSCGSEGGQ